MVWVGELGHNTYMYIHTSAIVDPCMQTARCGRRSEDASCEMRVLAQSGGRGGTNEGMAVGVKPAHGTVRGRAPRARLARHRPRPRTPRTVRCRLRLGIRGCCAGCEGLAKGELYLTQISSTNCGAVCCVRMLGVSLRAQKCNAICPLVRGQRRPTQATGAPGRPMPQGCTLRKLTTALAIERARRLLCSTRACAEY